jgi:hypothetical protein
MTQLIAINRRKHQTMGFRIIIAAALGTCCLPGVATAETTCTIAEKWQCTQGQGCLPIDNKIVIRMDETQKTYSRCDAKGCDDFPALFNQAGSFVNVAIPANGLLAKFGADGSGFVEVTTLGSTVLLSFGSCH